MPTSQFDQIKNRSANTVELLSFDIREQLPGWSFTLDIPQITEQVLLENPILFYLESEEACLKLPLNNCKMGYRANVFKNVGKIYVTFKSLKDGVSNFYVPPQHLTKLKVLIIKPAKTTISKQMIDNKNLKSAGININDYEDVLGYLSNMASIDFKGHFITRMAKKPVKSVGRSTIKSPVVYSTAS
ncbi:hypothetical protein [Flagellimonas zhangzhouensis]|uniref:Uncharacterized protein n=1 Tax=Flagellimonas zhangzhouensis TaxID=1073328 RepID=A0A1H2TZV4_9FLAO|nr:hypothetical protein [Allomuricauda zhangzhouensis]SDQ21646.1 hypothetical protein SAMN05216294_0911 [Allomuricauda zhangzhouensis]SDW49456.1 hypothetical protein SAMN04487892_1384 [Allomuricauda zhangzhouensis]